MSPLDYFIERLQVVFGKDKVPRDIVLAYERDHRSLLARSVYLQRFKTESFDQKEFIQFLEIQNKIMQGKGKFKGLRQPTFMLEAALDTAESLRVIFEAEMQYRGSAQQKFYQYVFKVLSSSNDVEEICRIFDRHLEKNLNKIQTEKGRQVICDYIKAVKGVIYHDFGINFLLSCKANKTDVFNVIRGISDIAKRLRKSDANQLKTLIVQVQANRDIFQELSKILGMQHQGELTQTFAVMLQYIALKHRHSKASQEFEGFLRHLKMWSNHYRNLSYILDEYDGNRYAQPSIMKKLIPCVDVYTNYKKYMHDYQIINKHKQKVLTIPKPRMIAVEDSEASMIFRVVQKESTI